MSVIASYARVNAQDLDRIRAEPDAFWQIDEVPWTGGPAAPGASQRLEIDKMWEGLSWLCSPLGRAEAQHMAALINVDAGIEGNDAFKAALAREVAAMGLVWVDPDSLPTDAVLAAIQGDVKKVRPPTLLTSDCTRRCSHPMKCRPSHLH